MGDEPEADVAIEDLEVADDDDMPQNEAPIGLKQAAGIIGRKSAGAMRSFIKRTGLPMYRPGASFVVFESEVRSAMRESRV